MFRVEIWGKENKCKVKKKKRESVSFSVLSDSVTPWTVTLRALLSMEFSRQEHWSE